jgi:hypothetical protein
MIPELTRQTEFTDVSLKYKRLINKILNKIISIDDDMKKKEFLYSIYNKVDSILDTHKDNKKIVRIFELLKYKLSIEILKI